VLYALAKNHCTAEFNEAVSEQVAGPKKAATPSASSLHAAHWHHRLHGSKGRCQLVSTCLRHQQILMSQARHLCRL
jgi:hypothetical protein